MGDQISAPNQYRTQTLSFIEIMAVLSVVSSSIQRKAVNWDQNVVLFMFKGVHLPVVRPNKNELEIENEYF